MNNNNNNNNKRTEKEKKWKNMFTDVNHLFALQLIKVSDVKSGFYVGF